MRTKSPELASLLDILIDGFEKNEIMYGCHWRTLPMPDEHAATRKIIAWIEEVTRWKGEPISTKQAADRRMALWTDLELWQVGRGLVVLVRAPNFGPWWNAAATWKDDPMGPSTTGSKPSVPTGDRSSRPRDDSARLRRLVLWTSTPVG